MYLFLNITCENLKWDLFDRMTLYEAHPARTVELQSRLDSYLLRVGQLFALGSDHKLWMVTELSDVSINQRPNSSKSSQEGLIICSDPRRLYLE